MFARPFQPAGSKRQARLRRNRQNTPLGHCRLGRWQPLAGRPQAFELLKTVEKAGSAYWPRPIPSLARC